MSKIKDIRTKLGVTQNELGKKLGVSQGAMNHYENGKREISLTLARKIVHALNQLGANCTFDDVFPDPQLNNTQNRKTA